MLQLSLVSKGIWGDWGQMILQKQTGHELPWERHIPSLGMLRRKSLHLDGDPTARA